MVDAVAGLLGGALKAQKLVPGAEHGCGQLVGAEVEDTRLSIGAKAPLLRGERAPLVRKLCRCRLVVHAGGIRALLGPRRQAGRAWS